MSLSHPVGTLVLQPSEPGAALTAPALAHIAAAVAVLLAIAALTVAVALRLDLEPEHRTW